MNLPQQLTSKGVHGVLIQQVKPGSFADEIGLAQGAVINEINKTPINNKSDYTTAVSALKSGQDVVVSIIDPRSPAVAISTAAERYPARSWLSAGGHHSFTQAFPQEKPLRRKQVTFHTGEIHFK